MINATENFILIDNKIKTFQIERCWFDQTTDRYNVLFAGNPTMYSYRKERVVWIKEPQQLDPNDYQIIKEGRVLSNIKSISLFNTGTQKYWHLRFCNNKEYTYSEEQLEISKSCLATSPSKNVFEYLKQVAAINGISTEEGVSLLSKQYDNIRFIDKNKAIAPYLNPADIQPRKQQAPDLIFPFGCNASQCKAVKNAFESQISVIQGPPGTGKTQTILNIVANILTLGKTVLVVSNNNSAITNIFDKLAEYELAFMVASLGKSENKEIFISTQTERNYPSTIGSWEDTESGKQEFKTEILRLTERLNTIFARQERLARAKQEVEALDLEWVHYKKGILPGLPEIELPAHVNPTQLLMLWNECQRIAEDTGFRKIPALANVLQKLRWFLFKLKVFRICKITDKTFYDQENATMIAAFHVLWYKFRIKELRSEIGELEEYLKTEDAGKLTGRLCEMSMRHLKNALYNIYGNNRERPIFVSDDFKNDWRKILKEYPVILSTTFSSRSGLNPNAVYDYVIMDEASQVSIETGALALSCAENAIIVGDSMQLPNVVTDNDRKILRNIARRFDILPGYDCADNSFLQSVCKILPDVPQTLLREHYRCHPKIINFCNQKFYGGNLIIMTHDKQEADVICAVKTVVGNHSREQMNRREIDVIKGEVLPQLSYDPEEIGIIAPYNNQVNSIKNDLGTSRIDVATVHKFQGREKNAVIMTTVDDIITPFSDDPNLLNVAVSRAKQKFYLVVSGNEQPRDGNICDLIAYIEYNNCSVSESKIHSIFDYLYQQYTEVRIAYLRKHKRISQYDSENLTYALIKEILQENILLHHLDVICHQPLNMLIRDYSLLNKEECKYAMHHATHIDFLIYNRVSKMPVLAVETDGYAYHKADSAQFARDKKKDRILDLYGIALVRLSTTGNNEKKMIIDKLMALLHLN
ncbi:MAG: AAA domain-containing protein [Bacteroidales bacterium]